ncbi:hypothetical protein [Dyella japonica]|uniref:Uncharacterized protein n=1 Tax=Dyella japonica TaxID=231455 RepID=A0ABV2JSA4_9GAMM
MTSASVINEKSTSAAHRDGAAPHVAARVELSSPVRRRWSSKA